jgi:single-stranded DNA-binding protein
MLTLTGNGRLTRDIQLRNTHGGKTVATISIASDRRDRDAQPSTSTGSCGRPRPRPST